MTQAFELTRPERRTTSVVFASPHSGRDYPKAFLERAELDARAIRSSEDAFVDLLFDCAPQHGAPFLRAQASRAFVDLNRAADELDPALIEGVRRPVHNPRVASGLGVIPRVVAGGRPIHRGRIALSEAQGRIDVYWRPYHDALQQLLAESHARFGEAILIDCHSMPHEAIEAVGGSGAGRPDVVLGDRFGAAASTAVVDRIEAAFTAAGLRVSRNMPFAGAYIVQHYGRPSRRQHAVQVEIDRSLYMDERLVEPLPDFEGFRRLVAGIVVELTDIGRPEGARVAAE
ncbi:N-formylglutamate deformylase [Rubellimicrobium mesophilum DSM 19309]|uniref:N-formylglutamate deformylase n=1 Tax=Rubellimicrobium mesophilum DSM 19309 TaxID=442562 RepID=A0A017HJ49_9RHOB|nr:N-formylglutamate amidohydrolase [Rubellimicrobium mesophilum]EYD74355.1 N-formylglutamate deformylase [Rubellimicrobium mesophilum DSM 19309]